MALSSSASCKLLEIGQHLNSSNDDTDVQSALQLISQARAVEQGNIEKLQTWLGATAALKLENEVLKKEMAVLKQENTRVVTGLRLRNEALTAENSALKKEVQEGSATLDRCLDTAIADSAKFREEYALLVKQCQNMKIAYDALAGVHQSLLQEHQSLVAPTSFTFNDRKWRAMAVKAEQAELITDTWDDLESVASDISSGGMSESAQTDCTPRRIRKAVTCASSPLKSYKFNAGFSAAARDPTMIGNISAPTRDHKCGSPVPVSKQ
jgi:hypothetical protein